MSEIKAELVKKLRDQTSVSMMECKRALMQTNGDLTAAIELLRKAGEATAIKKQARSTSEGLVIIVSNDSQSQAVALEINCETDFVAKNQKLLAFAQAVATVALNTKELNIAALNMQLLPEGQSIEQGRLQLITQLGENLVIKRIALVTTELQSDAVLGYYLHGASPAKIASIVCLTGANQQLARDLAMHVAAMRPEFITQADIPKSRYAKEQEIFMEQTKLQNADKAEDLLAKIVIGKVNKYFKELTLMDQEFIKDPKLTISQLLAQHKAKIIQVVRFEVGEGNN